jgi:hypothetical protein
LLLPKDLPKSLSMSHEKKTKPMGSKTLNIFSLWWCFRMEEW